MNDEQMASVWSVEGLVESQLSVVTMATWANFKQALKIVVRIFISLIFFFQHSDKHN